MASEVKTDARIIIWGRRALMVALVGLVLQIGAAFYWSPMTFILSAAIGLPLVLGGGALFGWSVLSTRLRDGGGS